MNAITSEFLLTEQERAQIENRDLEQLQKTLGYTFSDGSLLQEALCHSSFANEHGMHKSNERLEFLGDSVLNYVVARTLFKECPNAAEGELTRMRSELVRESSLYDRALTLRVPELVLHGRSMQSSSLPKSICADAVEAIIGAVCLDGGIEAASNVVRHLFLSEIHKNHRPALDPKSRLQALLQAHGIPLPSYELLSVNGPPHMPVFCVRLRVNGHERIATGSTRKGAEAAVADEMIKVLVFPDTTTTTTEGTKEEPPQPSPESLRRDLSRYASSLTLNPALSAKPRFARPDNSNSGHSNEPLKSLPHPVPTELDLKRIVQMAHRGQE